MLWLSSSVIRANSNKALQRVSTCGRLLIRTNPGQMKLAQVEAFVSVDGIAASRKRDLHAVRDGVVAAICGDEILQSVIWSGSDGVVVALLPWSQR